MDPGRESQPGGAGGKRSSSKEELCVAVSSVVVEVQPVACAAAWLPTHPVAYVIHAVMVLTGNVSPLPAYCLQAMNSKLIDL